MNTLLVLGLFALIGAASAADRITTEKIAKEQGYSFENYTIQTEDGYLLGVERIPCSKSNDGKACPIVVLAHGLSGSSVDFVILRNESLGLNLSDLGFDVWFLNFRGNFNSRKHVKLNPDVLVGKFWDFSFPELGTKDLPAVIDFIRNETGQDEIQFIGNSQAAAALFVLCIEKEEYQKYIKSAHLMSPVVYVNKLDSVTLKVGSKAIALIQPLPSLAANTEFRPNGTITKLVGNAFCNDEPRILCSDILFVLAGFNNITVEPSILGDVLGTTPAGLSTKCLLHYFQLHDSKKFCQYDYGLVGNLRRYNSRNPPEYDLSKINIPVFLYSPEFGKIIHTEDDERMAKELPNVKRVYNMKNNSTLLSPIYSPFAKSDLYDILLEDVTSVE
ncbi:gastric triacylglycerol lipase-like [Episyrphus balteatus]|uniref:gastric triacylglycerol lipase-like n=1 Tax=Episyrphus balteatus TaxID=286459 RepID=UPI002486004D|nr:gastric triacylglycerol lipase-like [Episyrphus balteatus]